MLTRLFALLSLVVVALLAGCNGDGNGDAAPEGQPGEVEWGDCRFEVPPGLEVRCGALDVPADRADPDPDTVRLAFGVVSSAHDDPSDDPIVYLAGGPGGDALELVPLGFGELYEPLMGDRDLIIVDQRGTGLSEPSLSCPEHSSWVRESLGAEQDPDRLAEQGLRALDDCRRRLVDQGVDFADYNSAASATDLDDLRQALGYEQWNLYGTSYGTRLALAAVRDHPDGIRSVVLDAAYPVTASLYEEIPQNAARAIEAFFALCEADAGCRQRFPDLEAAFSGLVAELDDEPVPLTVVDPMTGERFDTDLDGAGLVGFLFQSLYVTDLVAFLPEIIDRAADNDVDIIGVVMGALISDVERVAIAMQLAVQCQDEIPFEDRGRAAEAAAEHPLVEGFFERSITLGPAVFDVCDRWDAGEPEPAADEPVTSAIPALVLTGELDPITPPRWGEEVAADLINSYFFTFPFTGHGVLPSHGCAEQMIHQFLDDPATEPDSACIDEIEPPRFAAAGTGADRLR